MKSIRVNEFGPPSVLKLFQQTELPKLDKDQVLIKVESVGVNPVDTYRRSGNFPKLPKLPYTPGSDCAGTILEINADNHGLKIGQRVFTSHTLTGSYASHSVASLKHVNPLPDHLSFDQGAALGIPYFTAYSALFQRGGGTSKDIVLIHGASGGVGIAAIELAKACGMYVVGTAGTKEGIDLIKKVGADSVFNHREDGYIEKLKTEYGGKISLVIEMLANVNLVHDCNVAAARARIIVVGCRGEINFEPRLLMSKRLDIRGVSVLLNDDEELKEATIGLGKLLESGKISPIIEKVFNLEEADKAHEDIMSNNGKLGKIILKL